MATVSWTPEGRESLRAVVQYIARDAPRAADLFAGRIRRAVDRVAAFPLAGRIVPELGDAGVREVFVGRYRLIYRIVAGEDDIEVLLVHHGARLLSEKDLSPEC